MPIGKQAYELILMRFHAISEDALAGLDAHMQQFITRVRGAAPRSPDSTTHLADRIELRRIPTQDGVKYIITAPMPIIWTVTGTKKHIIRPRTVRHFIRKGKQTVAKGGVLAWKDAEGTHFATLVRHPGTKSQPWLHNLAREEMKIQTLFQIILPKRKH